MRWTLRTIFIHGFAVATLSQMLMAQTTISIRQDGGGDVVSLGDALDELPNRLGEPYVLEFLDSGTYQEMVIVEVRIRDNGSLTIRAASGVAPILRASENKAPGRDRLYRTDTS